MSDGPKRPRAQVLPIAEELVALLATACVRIEIAGSLRRGVGFVGDIELVAIPAIERIVSDGPADLFGNREKTDRLVNRLWVALDGFFEAKLQGNYIRKGERYRSFAWPCGDGPIQVDLFTATPQTWGWIYLLRTGSADFSHYVMQRLNAVNHTSSDGAIHKGQLGLVDGKWKMIPVGDPIATPTEQDVFDLAQIPFRRPDQRT